MQVKLWGSRPFRDASAPVAISADYEDSRLLVLVQVLERRVALDKLVNANCNVVAKAELGVDLGHAVCFRLAAAVCQEHKWYVLLAEADEGVACAFDGLIAAQEDAVYAKVQSAEH
jgi:hypothetical protein